MWVILSILAVAAVVLVGCQVTRAGYESAPYRVVRGSGQFEVRDYPALQVVETPMARTSTNADGSFMRLFRFISGANASKQKIAMTTPVFMLGSDSNLTMAFVLPAKLAADAVPKPADASVMVRTLPAGWFAVLRFRGGRSAKHEAAALEQLRARMRMEQLPELSPPVFAYFDPPWTLGFLRRNEVMVRTQSEK